VELFSCPKNIATTMLNSLLNAFLHHISASSLSGLPSESGCSMYGLRTTLLRSSERPSMRNPRSSCASCWSVPANWGRNLDTADLSWEGDIAGCFVVHSSITVRATTSASFPPRPRGLVVLMSFR